MSSEEMTQLISALQDLKSESMESRKLFQNIFDRLVRVETKLDSVMEVHHVAEKAHAIASEALQSTKAAHNRLNELKTDMKEDLREEIDDVKKNVDKDVSTVAKSVENLEENAKWMRRAVYTAALSGIISMGVALVMFAVSRGVGS